MPFSHPADPIGLESLRLLGAHKTYPPKISLLALNPKIG